MTTKYLLQTWTKRSSAVVCVLLFALAGLLISKYAGAAPIIFHVTPSAHAGDAIALQGSGFTSTPEVYAELITTSTPSIGAATLLTTLNSNTTPDYVSAKLPTSFGSGLYAVWVYDGTTASAPAYINQAHITQFEYTEVPSGYSFRLFGRNLYIGATPTVTFIDPSSGTHSAGVTTSGSDSQVLNITAPTGLVSGTNYTVQISNGYGGTYGMTTAPETIQGRSSGSDPFVLTVPWAPDYAALSSNVVDITKSPYNADNTGTVNVRPVIQQAINDVSAAGGGVVYFPAGTYKMEWADAIVGGVYTITNLINMKSNVVLQGAGTDGSGNYKSIIKYGYDAQRTDSTVYGWAFYASGITHSGICDLSIQNVDMTRTLQYATIRFNAPETDVFCVRDDLSLGAGSGLNITGVNHFLVADTTTEMTHLKGGGVGGGGPWNFVNSTYGTIRDNTVTYNAGRLETYNESHVVYDSNILTRDFDNIASGSYEYGGFESSGNVDCTLINNTLNSIWSGSGAPVSNNDGESILDQDVGGNDRAMGTVTSATSTTLTDTSQDWTWNYTGLGYYAAIVAGTGAGEFGPIASNTATTVTLAQAWPLTPDSTSKYTIQHMAVHWNILNNTLSDVPRGIWLYACSMADVNIAYNTLTNAEAIWLRTDYRTNDRFNVMEDMWVYDNTVQDTEDWAPAAIGSTAPLVGASSTFGTSQYGVTYYSNKLTAYTTANTSNSGGMSGESYHAQLVTSSNAPDEGLLGLLFEHNTATNCINGYMLNTGVHDSVLWDTTYTNVGTDVDNVTSSGATAGAEDTVTGP